VLEKALKDLTVNGVKTVSDIKPAVKTESVTNKISAPVNTPTAKPTVVEDKKPVENVDAKKEVIPISQSGLTADKVLGQIMISLRKNSEIMLWSVMQGVTATLNGDTLIITANGEGDEDVIGTDLNKSLIQKQLPDYFFKVEVKGSPKVKTLNQVDEEIERYKKIFGDDIIIVK
jgi:hypothetical protein